MNRSICLTMVLALIVGCQAKTASPPKPPLTTVEKLVGLSLDELKAQLGPPDSESRSVVPPNWAGAFGPRPTSLKPGDKYVSINYRDHRGEQIHIFAVSSHVYQRVKGVNPGDKSSYVLEVYTFPKGTVF